jgi:ribosome-binding protein aMBF1 (putative translation factor)
MGNEKYTCRCLKKTDKLISYFINGLRITICDDCAEELGVKNNDKIEAVDYEKVRKSNKGENYYHKIDTREK